MSGIPEFEMPQMPDSCWNCQHSEFKEARTIEADGTCLLYVYDFYPGPRGFSAAVELEMRMNKCPKWKVSSDEATVLAATG